MAKCPRCNKRAAKRFCPALHASICAVCCAQDRMIELVCPESCQHLVAARKQAGEREGSLRMRELMAEGRTPPGLTKREMQLIELLFGSIVETQRGRNGSPIGDLVDSEIVGAAENAIRNFETEESGIIYHHPAATPRIDELSRRIRAALDELAEKIAAETRPRRSEMVRALRYVRDEAEAHIKRNPTDQSSRDFLHFISLFVPWPKEEAQSKIITL